MKKISQREARRLKKRVEQLAVGTGRNGRARWFTVFERTA